MIMNVTMEGFEKIVEFTGRQLDEIMSDALKTYYWVLLQ